MPPSVARSFLGIPKQLRMTACVIWVEAQGSFSVRPPSRLLAAKKAGRSALSQSLQHEPLAILRGCWQTWRDETAGAASLCPQVGLAILKSKQAAKALAASIKLDKPFVSSARPGRVLRSLLGRSQSSAMRMETPLSPSLNNSNSKPTTTAAWRRLRP